MRLHVGLDAGGGGLDVEGMPVKSVVQVCAYTNSMGAATTLTFRNEGCFKIWQLLLAHPPALFIQVLRRQITGP